MFSKFSVIVLQLILCTFRGADQDHFAEIAKAISSETGINESEVLDLFARANALEKRLESVEKTKQMLKLDQPIQQGGDDHQEEDGEDRAGGADGGEGDEHEGVDAPRQEGVPISAEDSVVKAAGDPVLKAAGDPVLKAAGDPVLKAAGDPVVKSSEETVVKTAGGQDGKTSTDPSVLNVAQVEEPSQPGSVIPAGAEDEGKTRKMNEGKTNVVKNTGSQSSDANSGVPKQEVKEQVGDGKAATNVQIDDSGLGKKYHENRAGELLLAAIRESKKIAKTTDARTTVSSLPADITEYSAPKVVDGRRTVRWPDESIPARRLAGSNKKRRASRVELLVQFLSSRAEKTVENLKRYFGKNFEEVTALNFKKFRSDVLKAEKQIKDTETVLKLHGTVVSKTEDVKKSNSTALGLGLGLGLGLPALVAVVLTFLIKTNRLLLNFGFSSDNFTDNGSMV